MYVPGSLTPEFLQLRLGIVNSASCGRSEGESMFTPGGEVARCAVNVRQSASTQRGGYTICE